MVRILRGEIYLVNLEPVRGNEQGKVRPALVIQNNLSNKFSPLTIVAPITSKIYDKEYPTNVFLSMKKSHLKKDSTILLNQMRTIDKRRVLKKMGVLDSGTMTRVDLAIKVSLDLR